jgi:rhamnosyltransferase
MSVPSKLNICAVLTSYNPDSDFEERVMQICKQVGDLVIIDNNSNPQVLKLLTKISEKYGIHIILNSENLGVATALNQGIRWAKMNNYCWVILFDQDSLVSDDMVNILCDCYKTFEGREQIGIIGPGYSYSKIIPLPTNNITEYKEVKSIITSGSLFSISLFDELGPFRDDLFIDFVDIEYCLRARAKGFKVIKLESLLMQHRIGSETMHRLIWKELGTSNHLPWRRYYMIRNNIIVAKKYFLIYPGWVIKSLFNAVKSTLSIFFFEKHKLIKLRYFALGIIDGISGRVNRVIK